MSPIYLDRDTLNSFASDAVGQTADLLKQAIGASPPPQPVTGPPPAPPDTQQPPQQPVAVQAPTPSDSLTNPILQSPPPLQDFLATAGLTPQPSGGAADTATSVSAAPVTTQPPAAFSPPPLADLLSSAGLGDLASTVGGATTGAASAASNAVQGASQAVSSLSPPPLPDFLKSAGLGDQAPASNPVQAATQTVSQAASQVQAAVQDVGSKIVARTSQFGMGLDAADAMAFCGPAAAMAFAQTFGRNPTASEAKALAQKVGWNPDQGMAGIGSEQQLLQGMGIQTKLEQQVDWSHVAQDAASGNPVILSTPGHYYYVNGVRTNAQGQTEFDLGTSGTDLRGGSEWMTSDQINSMPQSHGPVAGALYADHPSSPTPSPTASDSSPQAATVTTAGMSGGGIASGQVGDRGQQILSGAADAASWLGDQGQKALQAVLVTEGGLNNARGDNGASAGPLQFYEGGQLANFAQQMNMTLDQAKNWVEQNPVAAVQWAIGTPDKPGYLGQAIAAGIQKGLSGADLATYAQQHGQVSDTPERAGTNWNALFGAGQSVVQGVTGAASAVGSTAQGAVQGAQKNAQGLLDNANNLVSQGQTLINNATSGAQSAADQTAQRLASINAEADRQMAANQAASDQTLADIRSRSQAATNGGTPPTPPQGPLDLVKQKFSDALDALGGLWNGAGQAAAAAPVNPMVTTPQDMANAGNAIAQNGPVALQNRAVQAVGQNVVGPAANYLLSGQAKNDLADTIESQADQAPLGPGIPQPVQSAALKLTAGFLRAPGVLDSMQTLTNLQKKYGNADFSQWSPEDQKTYGNSVMAVASVVGVPAVEGNLESALMQKQPWQMTPEELSNWHLAERPQGGSSVDPATAMKWRSDLNAGTGEFETLADLAKYSDQYRFQEALGKGWEPPVGSVPNSLNLTPAIKAGEPITVYRASDVGDIVPGSYVTESRQYAQAHGEANIPGQDWQMYSTKVYPDELMTYGDPHEFIYVPRSSEVALQRLKESAAARGEQVAAAGDVATQPPATDTQGQPPNPVSGRQGGATGLQFATTLGGAAAGGEAGYNSDQNAPLPERLGRAAVGAGLGALGGYGAARGVEALSGQAPIAGAEVAAGAGRQAGQLNLGPMPPAVGQVAQAVGGPPGSARSFDLNALAQMRQQFQAQQPPLIQGAGQAAKRTPLDNFIGYTMSNMLWGVSTAVHITTSQILQTLGRPTVEAAAGHPVEAVRDLAAMGGTISDAFAAFGRTIQTGQRQGFALQTPPLPGAAGQVLGFPLRLHSSINEFFRTLNSAGASAAEASRLLRENPNLSFQDVLQKYPKQIVDAGADAAARATFMEGGGAMKEVGQKFGQMSRDLMNSGNPAGVTAGLVMRWVVPMTHIPAVILGEGVRALPVVNEVRGIQRTVQLARGTPARTLASGQAVPAVAGDAYRAQQELGRTALTSFANFAILSEVAQGNITGSGPTSPAERERLMEAVDQNGNAVWRPNSIRLPGGRWFDYTGLGPIALPMAAIANGVDTAKDYANKPAEQKQQGAAQVPEFIGEMLNREVGTIGSTWFLRGLADTLTMIKEGNVSTAAGSEIGSIGDRLVPFGSLLNEVRGFTDPYQRNPQNPLERVESRIPILSGNVEPRIAASTGQPMGNAQDVGSFLFRGTPPGQMASNPVGAEVARLHDQGLNVSLPYEVKSYKGAVQTPGQQQDIRQQVGTAVNLYVSHTLADPKYAGLTDQQKAQAISQAVGQAQSAADITLSGNVARSPHDSALLQWAQTAHYAGISSQLPPDQIAQQNWQIQQAKAKLSDYRKQYGDRAEGQLRRDDPDAYRLSQRDNLDPEVLARKKRVIDQATGGALSQAEQQPATGGLVGVGSTTLP